MKEQIKSTGVQDRLDIPLPALLGLDQNPPGPKVKNKYFFASPLISQRLAILNNMVGSSNLVIVVIGERGSGKTTLMNRFITDTRNRWQTCRIRLKPKGKIAKHTLHNLENRVVFLSRKESTMRIIGFCLAAAFILFVPVMATGGAPPVTGDRVDRIRLEVPENPNEREYLGLDGQGDFGLSDIAAQLLIVEIFSMYCPHCQREAPDVNRLFESIEASKSLHGKVKMIGIGVGNSTYEVDHFRKHYKIPFPLFPDDDFSIHQSLGEVRTPYFFIVDIGSADKGRVLWTKTGKMDSLESFMDRLNGFIHKGKNQ